MKALTFEQSRQVWDSKGFLGYKTSYYTLGGYKIHDLQKLSKYTMSFQENRGNLKPFLYAGWIKDPVTGMDVFVKWDADGKCANHNRKDCFVDPKVFKWLKE